MNYMNPVLVVTENGEATLLFGSMKETAYEKDVKVSLVLELRERDLIALGNAHFRVMSRSINLETGSITLSLEHVGGMLSTEKKTAP